MPRAHNLGIEGGLFHLTHRCHNRQHYLKFACDRDAYRTKLREELAHFDVTLLDYCITLNHVHLLVETEDRLEIAGLMQKVAGETARNFNRRKGRINAFWGDNYHATFVQGGQYLWHCLVYIELNMVRNGVVADPKEWEWVGYHEIMGDRRRYRLLNLEKLCSFLATDNIEAVRHNLRFCIDQRIAERKLAREPFWTESLAVGSLPFLTNTQPRIRNRQETQILQCAADLWVLREFPPPYGEKIAPKTLP